MKQVYLRKAEYSGEYVFSVNVYDALPDREISLGIQLRSAAHGQGVNSGMGGIYIFIYKE